MDRTQVRLDDSIVRSGTGIEYYFAFVYMRSAIVITIKKIKMPPRLYEMQGHQRNLEENRRLQSAGRIADRREIGKIQDTSGATYLSGGWLSTRRFLIDGQSVS